MYNAKITFECTVNKSKMHVEDIIISSFLTLYNLVSRTWKYPSKSRTFFVSGSNSMCHVFILFMH